MRSSFFNLLLISSFLVSPLYAQDKVPQMNLVVEGIGGGKRIPDKFAYCIPDGKGSTKPGQNISPGISWAGVPQGTKSFVLIVVDKDVPASFESANQAGKTIPTDFARQDFYHWVTINIPPHISGILEGKDSNGITPGGKPHGATDYGLNGQNDYAKVSKGAFGGYDGPCPPWNDERLHHYHFRIYALDIPSLELPMPIKGIQAELAMKDHILAMGEVIGTFSTKQ